MPLDEKEKEALKERYKEHRQSIWFGKHSRKLKRKKDRRDVDNFVSRGKKEETKARISAEQPTKSVEIENATSVKESKRRISSKLADYEGQNQMVILRRPKGKKSVSEAPTEMMPSVSERTTLYEPESTRRTEIRLPSPDDKTTMLERNEPRAKSSSSPNVAELSTKLEVIPKPPPSLENMLKEKNKSQRQEIWAGASSQKKRRPKLKERDGKKAEKNLGLISAQNSQETKKGLTLGAVFIGIAAVVAAIALGVLLGYLLA